MKNTSTRLLLSIAAIGVACGLLNIGNAYVFNTLAVAAPAFLGAATGIYFLPGVIAQAAFRRGGVALLALLVAGLVQAPFVPGGVGSVSAYAMIGILLELPFALVGYRYWKPWLAYVAAVFTAGVYSVYWALYYDLAAMPLWFQLAVPGVLVATLLLFTFIGRWVAAGLARTGVLRGLQPAEDRRRSHRRSAGPAATASADPTPTGATAAPSDDNETETEEAIRG